MKVKLLPSDSAIHLISKEIQHRARVYSLFDVSKLFLDSRERIRLHIEVDENRPPLFRGKRDESLFVTKEEAAAHFLKSDALSAFYESEEVETEAPAGNFQVVARCGLSGEWLGPPNFHDYQNKLRRLHRERFSHMPFDRYAAKVRTERGEEAVQAWLETMKKRTRWRRVGGGDDDWTFDRAEIERDFQLNFFHEAFEETRKTELPGEISGERVSEGIMAAIRIAGGHARRHPAMMIPAICHMLESDHLAIFKRKGKLFCGPARPHPIDDFGVLAERPSQIVRWLDVHDGSKLGELWAAMLPEGAEEPPREWLVDLFWLLTQGHVLLFSDDTLILPKRSKPAQKKAAVNVPAPAGGEEQPPSPGKKRKARKRKARHRPAKHPSQAGKVRRISRMSPGALRALRGESRLWSRRLARRGKLESMREEEPRRGRLR